MNEADLPTQRLPIDHEEAIVRLAQEVNRLNGQIAGLLAFIKALDIRPSLSQAELTDKAHEGLPPLLLGHGPSTYMDHARNTLVGLLDED